MNKKRTITLALAAVFVMSVFTSTALANIPPPPPSTGDEGCTPGFWKNHLSMWVTYTPYTPYLDTGMTFLQALRARGGKENRLARHGAAALLNVASGDVAYSLTYDEVMAYIADGRAGKLERANEAMCPLGGRAVKWVPPPVQ